MAMTLALLKRSGAALPVVAFGLFAVAGCGHGSVNPVSPTAAPGFIGQSGPAVPQANAHSVKAHTITFDDLLIADGSPFAAYTEAAFHVMATSGPWIVKTAFGNPAPFIEFMRAASATMTISVKGPNDRLFTFQSADLYSSVTTIPYVFTGRKDGADVFTATGTVPNTFGSFATVSNPSSGLTIDTLVITLSNPACCSNPVGIDNLVLGR
jgi:hypothetical protein